MIGDTNLHQEFPGTINVHVCMHVMVLSVSNLSHNIHIHVHT